MQNPLLIGLSRQVVLERQMDVVANNLANINTNGFKAERSVFQEFLNTGAHEDNFQGRDRRVSFVQDRAAYHDFAGGPLEETKNPLDIAIDGNAFLVVQTPNGERFSRYFLQCRTREDLRSKMACHKALAEAKKTIEAQEKSQSALDSATKTMRLQTAELKKTDAARIQAEARVESLAKALVSVAIAVAVHKLRWPGHLPADRQ